MRSSVASELEALREKDTGLLRPDDIVEAAADPASTLHSHFEWDDSKAAHAHRLVQARMLIRQVKVPLRIGAVIVKAPAYVPAPTVPNAYQRLDEVTIGSDRARAIVLDELGRVSGILGRARTVATVLELEAEIDDLLAAAAGLRSRIDGTAPAETTPA